MSDDPAAPSALKSFFVFGGARSGKSRYAQALADASGKAPWLIATATPGDAEMAARIAAHKTERPGHWSVIEEPIDVTAALIAAAAPQKVIVVDCLTLWLSNLMLGAHNIEAQCDGLARAVPSLAGPAIFVSNEVGLGIVPDGPLGRMFRDAQGRLNQMLAAACDAVVFVAAGLPLQLKPHAPALRL